MAISLGTTVSGESTTAATSYTTASVTWAADDLIIAQYCIDRNDSTEPVDPTVTDSGAALTWTQEDKLYWDTLGTARGKSWIFAAYAASSGSGTITFNHGATGNNREAQWAITPIHGTDGVNGVTQSFVQFVHTAVDATGTSASATLAAAGSTNNRGFVWFGHSGSGSGAAPLTGWTEIAETIGSAILITEAQWSNAAFNTAARVTAASSFVRRIYTYYHVCIIPVKGN